MVKNICLTSNEKEMEGRVDKVIKVMKTCYLKKAWKEADDQVTNNPLKYLC